MTDPHGFRFLPRSLAGYRPTNENQDVTSKEIAKIRKLEDFDLIVLISEIHNLGWLIARQMLALSRFPEPISDDHQDITPKQIANIRKLAKFDLIMLISEIHDHGWIAAIRTLAVMPVEEPIP